MSKCGFSLREINVVKTGFSWGKLWVPALALLTLCCHLGVTLPAPSFLIQPVPCKGCTHTEWGNVATGRLHSSTYITGGEKQVLLAGVAQDNASFSTSKIWTGFCFHKTVYHTVHSQKALEVEPFTNSIRILNIHIFVASTLNIQPVIL